MPLVRPTGRVAIVDSLYSRKGDQRLKNTSFPRLAASAALLTALVLPSVSLRAQQAGQQSYLRNVGNDVEVEAQRVQQIINSAEDHFKKGELNLKDNKREAARQEFDKSVDTVLESGMDVRSNPQLQTYYLQLVERVYRYEVPQSAPVPASLDGAAIIAAAQNGGAQSSQEPQQVGFTEQKFEPSPLDELAKIELNDTEKNVSDQQVADAEVVKNTLDFPFKLHPLVLGYVNYYQGRGRATMETGLRRSGQYMAMARKAFREEGVPEDLVWLGQVESAWRPTARSEAAASGLWQFIPGTGSRFGLRQTAYVDERNSFEKATHASARYLKWLHDRYGNWELAMAAYNTGEGNVDRAIARAGASDFWAIYPYVAQQTRNYVPNILAVILISKSPEKYGFRNVQRMAPLPYDIISVPSATSLDLIASLSDTSLDYIRSLNPELRRDMTPPGEAYTVRVPAHRGPQTVALLKRIPVERRTQVARVVHAAPGESFESVAGRAGVSVAQLEQWNAGVNLTKGGALVVPAGGGFVRTLKSYERPTGGGASSGGGLVTVTARGGETVAQIAARYNASVEEVVKLNGIAPDAPLARGQQIKVPTQARTAPAQPAASSRRR
jgi:membrane-bound lytic murein transglycosylase D